MYIVCYQRKWKSNWIIEQSSLPVLFENPKLQSLVSLNAKTVRERQFGTLRLQHH